MIKTVYTPIRSGKLFEKKEFNLYTFKQYVRARSLDEAYDLISRSRANYIAGGCHFLKTSNLKINKFVDLKDCADGSIVLKKDFLHIGAGACFSDIENDENAKKLFSGVVSKSISNILSPQFRNTAQIGAHVFSRHPFSDIIPVLSVLNSKVLLYKAGIIGIDDFTNSEKNADILISIEIPLKNLKAASGSLRISSQDFPVIVVAVSKDESGKVKVSFGARPGRSFYAEDLSNFLTENEYDEKEIENFLEKIPFGKNRLADSSYRRKVACVLLKQCLDRIDGELHD